MTSPLRETFTSRFGTLMTMIGVAVGLGNVWRFPYMVGRFGGAAFVMLYVVAVLAIGVPALMAEWALGRHTRRGPLGAFSAGGLPFGRSVGWFFFFVVSAATAYYTAVVGWVLYFTVADLVSLVTPSIDPAAILPPDEGFSAQSFLLQMACTGIVILACAAVLLRGLRSGIEVASKVIMPTLFVILLVLVVRSLTLPGAMEGAQWYILKFSVADINAKVVMAAMGQAIFSLSLGGTFMVVYGSYLSADVRLAGNAALTAVGDMSAGLLAGLAIIPAAMALGLEPSSGPTLLFSTLPQVFASIPLGWLFGFLFFAGLFGAAYLSDVAAFEVLVAGLTDNTRLTRTRAIWVMAAVVFLLAIPPSINNGIFVPWDLTFGSGMQTLGSLLAVVTIGWCVNRSTALKALAGEGGRSHRALPSASRGALIGSRSRITTKSKASWVSCVRRM
jgi:NSS family neurotransmitter:Na+ symporter